MNSRIAGLCIILFIMAALLQAAPAILGDSFSFAAVLGGVPVFMAARLNCAAGAVVYFTAAAVFSFMNLSEALFFICINGIIGLSEGISINRLRSIYHVPVPSALLVFTLLSAVNHILGIRLFDTSVFKAPLIQAAAFLPLLYLYCLLLLKISMLADAFLHRKFRLNR